MSKISLELGDIIQISAPSNPDLNEKIFLIDYLDDNKIIILSEENTKTVLNILDERLSDKTIEGIFILNKNPVKGFARQNNLLPDQWISVYFSGDIPFVINGIIRNLIEDRIEILSYPDNKTLFIDFEYKGIPQNLPIEKIILRNQPDDFNKNIKNDPLESNLTKEIEGNDNPDTQLRENVKDYEQTDTGEQNIEDDITYNTQMLKEEIISGDEIKFGKKLGAITQIIEVDEKEKRFGITNQTNDLLDELLSRVPNNKRNRNVLNHIYKQIERYKQLRNDYSNFDINKNVFDPF